MTGSPGGHDAVCPSSPQAEVHDVEHAVTGDVAMLLRIPPASPR